MCVCVCVVTSKLALCCTSNVFHRKHKLSRGQEGTCFFRLCALKQVNCLCDVQQKRENVRREAGMVKGGLNSWSHY